MANRLGVGLVGSGFIADFHVRAFLGVRDADIVAIQGRNRETVAALAGTCRETGVGDPATYRDVVELVRDPRVDAVWVTTPNHLRVETVRAIVDEVTSGRARLTGVAIEKPLARTVAEGKQIVEMLEDAGLLHGYLENQVFAPALNRAKELVWQRGAALAGPPYLARCAEEHSGPHRAWFWQGDKQGGGVLNDMMCHSVEAGRHLLVPPDGRHADWLTPTSVSASIASLKWTRPKYADELVRRWGPEVDYRRAPAEDYARATITYRTREGDEAIVEATTSWSYVGAGLRLRFELLGPEYALSASSLDTEAAVFLSREIRGTRGEDLVEKQNAEQGLMPVIPDEAATYGYTEEDRHMVQAFLRGVPPAETLHDGLFVTRLLMCCYRSAQEGRTIAWDSADVDDFVPDVARGTWRP